jgi:hypothetical protein
MESVGVKPEGIGSIPVCCSQKDSSVVEQVNYDHRVAGSRATALTKQNQILSNHQEPKCFPAKRRWEAAGKPSLLFLVGALVARVIRTEGTVSSA